MVSGGEGDATVSSEEEVEERTLMAGGRGDAGGRGERWGLYTDEEAAERQDARMGRGGAGADGKRMND